MKSSKTAFTTYSFTPYPIVDNLADGAILLSLYMSVSTREQEARPQSWKKTITINLTTNQYMISTKVPAYET